MTNLSDLLPAGAGQNNTDFVADGGITSGKPVVLTAAGKASEVVESGDGLGTPSTFASQSIYYNNMTYDTAHDRVVVWYLDGFTGGSYSNYPMACVGTVSTTGITWGTPVALLSGTMGNSIDATFDATLGKHLVVFNMSSQGKAMVGTVSTGPDTIAFGTTELFTASYAFNIACEYDPSTTRSLIVYRLGSTGKAMVAIPTASSTITFGAELEYLAATAYPKTCYDTNQNKVVVASWEIPSNYEVANYVATINAGTNAVTFGARNLVSSVAGANGYPDNTAVAYDASANAVINFYRISGGGLCRAGTISGDSVTYGTELALGTDMEMADACYDVAQAKVALSYFRSTTTHLRFFSLSGSAVTADAEIEVGSSGTAGQYNANVYDPDNEVIAFTFDTQASTPSQAGIGNVYESVTTNMTSTNLLGIASGAILDTATGTINTWGSRNEVQTSLTIGSDYYVQTDGTITTTSTSPAQLIGKAITATQINIKDYTG